MVGAAPAEETDLGPALDAYYDTEIEFYRRPLRAYVADLGVEIDTSLVIDSLIGALFYRIAFLKHPVSAVDAGTCQPAAASAVSRPEVISRSTCPYGRWLNRHSPSTKYTPSREGTARSRISHASPSPTASSTRSGEATHDSTPIPARERTRPRRDNQPHDVTP